MAKSYRELIVWQKAMALAEMVYAVTSTLPAGERYGLVGQLQRAAVSVPSNIAEGHERRSRADYRRFITIACGSLAELETQLELADRIYQLDSTKTTRAHSLCDETGRLLRAIERGLRENRIGETPSEYEVTGQPSALSSQLS